MSAVAAEEYATLPERLAAIGDVPPHRVVHSLHTATVSDVQRLAEREPKRFCELVDGLLVEKAAGFRESLVASVLIQTLRVFVSQHKLGLVSGEQGAVRLLPASVRIPDVAFFSWESLPDQKTPTAAIPAIAPDLAVEVLSDSNTAGEMSRKRRDYFAAGVKLVWEVDLLLRLARVYEPEGRIVELGSDDVLTGGSVLPGFSIRVADLFVDLGPVAG